MGLALGALLFTGCAVNPPLELAQLAATDTTQLRGVPFYPQTEYECGPAALAGVLGASGVAITPQSLSPQVYLPGRQGSFQVELVAAVRRAGRIPYLVDVTPQALVAELEAGKPVLVLQNLQTRHFPVWHYAVLTGLDARANQLFLNSGEEQARPIDAPVFLRTWDWAGRWALVALRPGELPAGAQAADYIDAVLSFEAVAGTRAAVPAWETALRQWPQDVRPFLAMGNQAYADDQLQAAADYFRRGLQVSPEQPALTNNLASVLGELGCPRAAEALLRPLADRQASDSQWSPVMAATLAELAAQGGLDPAFCRDRLITF
ncbi:MAG TPA: PA2778 family cysteine peptidase [Halioglobus sp.]